MRLHPIANPYRVDSQEPDHAPRTPRRSLPSMAAGQLRLTSMIDVVFLLLIYFVVSASFAIDEGLLTTRIPHIDPHAEAAPPLIPLNIRLSSAGAADVSLRIDGRPEAIGSFTELTAVLRSLQRDPAAGNHGVYPPQNPLIIRGEGRVRWTHIANAQNAAVAAGFTNVQFAKPGT